MTPALRDARLPGHSHREAAVLEKQDNTRPEFPPAFKPVALPALAAAVRSAYREPARKPEVDFTAILRINAMLD